MRLVVLFALLLSGCSAQDIGSQIFEICTKEASKRDLYFSGLVRIESDGTVHCQVEYK